jgi:signal transduction histidine kinase
MLMPVPSRSSLARSTLLKMGARIAVVIALTTFFSYLHMQRNLRGEALSRLQQHVSERSHREQDIFLLARDNHTVIKKALEERLQALQHEDVSVRFDSLFVRLPDGTFRNRAEGFDGTRVPSVFVPVEVKVDLDMKRRILAAYDVVSQYGPAFHARFVDTYITLAEGPLVVYWPDRPRWGLEAELDYPCITSEYYTISLPENDPERKTVWSRIYQEEVSRRWMVATSTPVDIDGRHVATLHHDVALEQLMARTINDHLPGAYNVIFREDGELIAHPGLDAQGNPRAGSEVSEEHLRNLIERVKQRAPGQAVLELPEHDEYLAVARLEGPGWYFATVLPDHVVSQPALQAARLVLLLGVLSLLLELGIMAWVLRRQITHPLEALTHATERVSTADFQVKLDTSRKDELGQLAGAFERMAQQVQRREEELRQANESLERRVEERTRELKEVHAQLVQTARQAGMAEVATSVLHNVGNVLNSVYTSAQVAKERVSGMRVEHVGKVAHLLEEQQENLVSFLTQDERGQYLRPFLSKLGKNLLDERQEVVSLLEEVGRYTEHIGDIVKVQQSYARMPRLQEPVLLANLVEDALRINSAGLTRHQVQVERQLAPLPQVMTDKNKALMILVNLISNAKYAMDAVPVDARRLVVKLERPTGDRMRLEVQDNGMGVAPDMRTRIFQYGFTTRAEGHGFGLHSSALAAQELGGSLTVQSEGLGRGATFILELPYHPAPETP